MDDTPSFGYWIRRRRKALDLTQQALAQQVGCSLGAIRKLEADVRRPSPEMADRLADVLELADAEQVAFLKVARAERATDQLVSPTMSVVLSPRSSRVGSGKVPVAATPLIGRAAEVATVSASLEQPSVRLLTLTGPGGTGKTRLALAVALAIQDHFADGAAFVDLAPIREPALVLVTIAAALGVAEQREQPLLATMQDAMREKQLLLVLDNFEQVVTAAPLLADLLRSAPGLKLLVTSRIVLGLSGEHVVAVPPLELPVPLYLRSTDASLAQLLEVAAIRLFVDRATAASSTFVVTEAHAQVVIDICQRLDGLPLAIELAAARTRVLSPAALLLRLGQRLPLLTGGARDLPMRQQTLRATIDWSYDLLMPAEQRLFRRVAVFVGGWTMEAAEAVTGLDGTQGMEVLDQLQALLENSLILKSQSADGTRRFGLYETLREYALERLEDSGEALAVRQQHTSYYVQLAEAAASQVSAPEQSTRFERLERENDNLRAALAWSEAQPGQTETMLRLAAALTPFWRQQGYLNEGIDWMQRALRHMDRPPMDSQRPAPDFLRLRAHVLGEASGWAAVVSGNSAQARIYAHESLALYEALGDTAGPGLAAALAALANVMDDAETAIPLLERSVAMYRALGDDAHLSDVLGDLGRLAKGQGNYAQSEVFFTEALDITRAITEEEGIFLQELGALALHQHDSGRAVSLLEESVRRLRRQHVIWTGNSLGWALIHLAEARRVVGDPLDGAGSASGDETSIRELWEEGLALFRAAEERTFIAWVLVEVGEMLYEQGEDARAAGMLRESIAALRDLNSLQALGCALDAMGALVAHGSTPAALSDTVRLWSAATKWHQNRPRLSPVRRSRYDQTFAAVRRQLDEAMFVAAWAEGQQLSLQQAIAYALDETERE